MKKSMTTVLVAVSMMLFSGCGDIQLQKEVSSVNPVETPVVQDDIKVIPTPAEEATYLEGLNLFKQTEVSTVDGEILINLYVDAQVDDQGELILDDGQEWALVAHKDDVVYPLIPRTYIQNGELNYTVYTDYEESDKLHIIGQLSASAEMHYYDFTYEDNTFNRKTIFEASNINLIIKS